MVSQTSIVARTMGMYSSCQAINSSQLWYIISCNWCVFAFPMQPLRSSGDPQLVHFWWLLAAVLVSVKVITG